MVEQKLIHYVLEGKLLSLSVFFAFEYQVPIDCYKHDIYVEQDRNESEPVQILPMVCHKITFVPVS